MSAVPTMTAPATMPAIAPPERPLLVTAAAFVCGVDVEEEEEVGNVDVNVVGGAMKDEDDAVTGGDCVLVEKMRDDCDGVVAEEGAREED